MSKIINLVLLILFILLIVYIGNLYNIDIVGYRHDWNLNYFGISYFWDNFLFTWRENGLGSFTQINNPFLVEMFLGILSKINISGFIVSKIEITLIILISYYSFFKLLKNFKINKYINLIISLLYALGPVVFNNLISGYIWYLVSYAFSPLCINYLLLAFLDKSKNRYSKYVLISGLLLAICFSQFQFIVMLSILIFLILIFNIKNIKTVFYIYLIAIIIHIPWILGLLTSANSSFDSVGSISVSKWNEIMSGKLDLIFYTIANYQNRYFYNFIEEDKIWFMAIGILLILTFPFLVFQKKNKIVLIMLVFLVIAIFLAKGLNKPLQSVSIYIYQNIPYYESLFRQSYHFMWAVIFSFLILIAYNINLLFSYLEKIKTNIYIKILLYLGLISISFVYLKPFFNHDFQSELNYYIPNENYKKINNDLNADKKDYRIMWLPAIGPMRQDDLKYSINFDPIVEYFPKKSFSSEGGILFFEGNSTNFRNYILYLLNNNIPNENFGKILGLANIKNIYEREDYKSEYLSVSNLGAYEDIAKNWSDESLDEKLKAQKGINFITNMNPIEIYENQNNLDLIYASKKPLLTTQNLSILESDMINKYDSFIFLDQISQLNLNSINIDKLNINDLTISMIDEKYKMNLTNYANNYFDARDGFINGKNWFWYDKNFVSNLKPFVFSLKKDEIKFKKNLEAGKYKLLIKVYILDSNAKTNIQINDKNYEISGKNINFEVKELGDIEFTKSGTQNISVKTNGNSAISEMVLVPIETWDNNISKANECIKNYIDNDIETKTNLLFEKINPTLYKINYNSQTPFYLIFSSNFNNNWVLKDDSGKKLNYQHFIANGFANGFYIKKTGMENILLEFEPQRNYQITLLFSMAVFFGLIGIIVYLSFRKH